MKNKGGYITKKGYHRVYDKTQKNIE